ncbi:MAG TPA: hypothetical protein VFM54_20015 [Micromonosporaceae bacterium]|nr:hypothetical protein [Micromonosporaceae bacterium]
MRRYLVVEVTRGVWGARHLVPVGDPCWTARGARRVARRAVGQLRLPMSVASLVSIRIADRHTGRWV